MFRIKKRYKGLRWNTIYFAENRMKQAEKGADIIEYNYLMSDREEISNIFPHFCESSEFTTLVTNLKQDENELFEKIEKNCRYKIRRAEREGVAFFCYDASIERGVLNKAIDFYNQFVDTKEELSFKLSESWISPFLRKNAFWCTMAVKNGEILVVHIYYGDDARVCLWCTASLFRNENDTQKRNEIGRANRFLHWKDICFFKEKGFGVYDWGGYSTERATAGNAAFKKSFGGEVEKGICLLMHGSLWGKLGLFYRKIKNGMRQ